jgi:signal transduction histidine kinase
MKFNFQHVAQSLTQSISGVHVAETNPFHASGNVEHALHHLPVALLVLNEHDDILFANEPLQNLLGLVEVTPPASTLSEWPFYLNPLRKRIRDYIASTHESPSQAAPLERQSTLLLMYGKERNIGFSIRTETVQYQGKPHYYWILVASDITGQAQAKAIEEGLRRARYQALHTGSIARQLHAFSSCLFPALFAISQQASLIEQESRHERVHRASQHIQESIKEVQHLFDILEAMYTPPIMHVRNVQFGLVLRQWLKEFSEAGLFPQGACVDVEEHTFTPMVRMDARLIKQVVKSILQNAVEAYQVQQQQLAMPAGHSSPPLNIRLKFTNENCDGLGHMIKLHIQDNGPGMAPHAIEQAFDPFFTTKPNAMLGVGLARAFHIMEAHHGFITLDPLPNGASGVHVCLYLPENPSTTV